MWQQNRISYAVTSVGRSMNRCIIPHVVYWRGRIMLGVRRHKHYTISSSIQPLHTRLGSDILIWQVSCGPLDMDMISLKHVNDVDNGGVQICGSEINGRFSLPHSSFTWCTEKPFVFEEIVGRTPVIEVISRAYSVYPTGGINIMNCCVDKIVWNTILISDAHSVWWVEWIINAYFIAYLFV